jgi:hypothetical protein
MKIEFVTYEQAIQLKELGFNEPCFGYYGENQKLIWKSGYAPWTNSERNLVDNHFTAAPLKTQVFKWFREKYNIIGLIEGGFDMTNIFTYCIWEGFKDKIYDDYYGTYEEAEDVLINILIDKVKNK